MANVAALECVVTIGVTAGETVEPIGVTLAVVVIAAMTVGMIVVRDAEMGASVGEMCGVEARRRIVVEGVVVVVVPEALEENPVATGEIARRNRPNRGRIAVVVAVVVLGARNGPRKVG